MHKSVDLPLHTFAQPNNFDTFKQPVPCLGKALKSVDACLAVGTIAIDCLELILHKSS